MPLKTKSLNVECIHIFKEKNETEKIMQTNNVQIVEITLIKVKMFLCSGTAIIAIPTQA